MSVVMIAAAVATVLSSIGLTQAIEAQTRRIQRDIGLNIVILPPGTDLARWWIAGVPRGSMPESWIDDLQSQDVANRLVPMLVATEKIGNIEALLTGIDEERFKRGNAMKAVYGRLVEPGSIVLGATIADAAQRKRGDTVMVRGVSFTVARTLAATGSIDDMRAWVALEDAQALLEMPGRLNEIRALECHCAEDVADPLAAIQMELEPLIPGARIVRMDALADARRTQRQLTEEALAIAGPGSIILAGIIVAALAALNVRDRRRELGTLRALEFAPLSLAGLVLIRAAFIGVAGAVVGLLASTFLLDPAMGSFASAITRTTSTMLFTIGGAAGCAVIASVGPAIVAAMSDPARMMRVP